MSAHCLGRITSKSHENHEKSRLIVSTIIDAS